MNFITLKIKLTLKCTYYHFKMFKGIQYNTVLYTKEKNYPKVNFFLNFKDNS